MDNPLPSHSGQLPWLPRARLIFRSLIFRIAANTVREVDGETFGCPFRTRCTVATPTLAASAISLTVPRRSIPIAGSYAIFLPLWVRTAAAARPPGQVLRFFWR